MRSIRNGDGVLEAVLRCQCVPENSDNLVSMVTGTNVTKRVLINAVLLLLLFFF